MVARARSGPAPPRSLAPQSSLPTSPQALTKLSSPDGPVPAHKIGGVQEGF